MGSLHGFSGESKRFSGMNKDLLETILNIISLKEMVTTLVVRPDERGIGLKSGFILETKKQLLERFA